MTLQVPVGYRIIVGILAQRLALDLGCVFNNEIVMQSSRESSAADAQFDVLRERRGSAEASRSSAQSVSDRVGIAQ